jgi:hypothetical protein
VLNRSADLVKHVRPACTHGLYSAAMWRSAGGRSQDARRLTRLDPQPGSVTAMTDDNASQADTLHLDTPDRLGAGVRGAAGTAGQRSRLNPRCHAAASYLRQRSSSRRQASIVNADPTWAIPISASSDADSASRALPSGAPGSLVRCRAPLFITAHRSAWAIPLAAIQQYRAWTPVSPQRGVSTADVSTIVRNPIGLEATWETMSSVRPSPHSAGHQSSSTPAGACAGRALGGWRARAARRQSPSSRRPPGAA